MRLMTPSGPNALAKTPLVSRSLFLRACMAAFLCLTAICLSVTLTPNAAMARTYTAMVIDGDTGDVLHEYRADHKVYPASLTKIMTLYMLFDALDNGKVSLSTPMKVSQRAWGQAPSKLGLKAGQTISVKDAILALVTKSANDIAVVVAEHLGGTEVKFAQMMTAEARRIGMKQTTFRNASGLPNRGQMTTARDMIKLAVALRKNFGSYYHYFSTQKFRFGNRTYGNHNNLLASYYGTDGIKTGYINASGFNLVASVNRNGKRLIGVVFGGRTARTRDDQMKKLLDRAYVDLLKEGDVSVPRPRISPNDKILPADTQLLMAKRETIREAEQPGRVDTQTIVTRMKPDTDGGWAIQVGAFSDQRRAQEAVLAAARTAPDVLRLTRAAVEQQASGTGVVYRARLLGFGGESEARAACAALRRENVACIPVNAGDAG
ncbi:MULTISPECIES: D-alanyl-D-alanine carboxypeptidase family protein [Thalassospira]|uniref:D-alanyl-D-alanine carboxypeptidase n=2 Tax=Thalassospira TaxID=168934 RepID=A0A367W3S1_9PROT|nr:MULTISPECIES: D-alanyl-D-alanine carboxypeptidase family protein [Thalassospira]MDG4721279.1 D-alanyl-D-alanine carboxypeptidase [Thalassospira sp. FZY0004]RCK33622.1 D-alanyl-D-alanine carboxypeptidase [Thalassospira profundimaris]